jgi:heme-degrading monooxygenase HmoA
MRSLVAALALASFAATQNPEPAARADDVKSMDAIVAAVYDVISGPAGQKRDWDRMRSLFVPGARLIPAVASPTGGATARVLDVDAYIQRSGPVLERDGFFEHEIARKTEAFGNIAHVFSTYESKHKRSDPAPFARGINSIQLLKDGGRWWIVTIYWDSEKPEKPIPAEYLPKQ